ncbi:Transposable element Hobo transposase, partial [Frankliniella fusca]
MGRLVPWGDWDGASCPSPPPVYDYRYAQPQLPGPAPSRWGQQLPRLAQYDGTLDYAEHRVPARDMLQSYDAEVARSALVQCLTGAARSYLTTGLRDASLRRDALRQRFTSIQEVTPWAEATELHADLPEPAQPRRVRAAELEDAPRTGLSVATPDMLRRLDAMTEAVNQLSASRASLTVDHPVYAVAKKNTNKTTDTDDVDVDLGYSDGEGDSVSKKESYAKLAALAQSVKDRNHKLVEMKDIKPNAKTSSKIWNVMRVLCHKDTGVVEDAVQCGICKKVLAYNERRNGTTSLSRHLASKKCKKAKAKTIQDTNADDTPDLWDDVKFEPQPDVKRSFIKTTAEYCAWDLRPLDCVKNKGFINLIQAAIDIGSRYGRVDATKLVPCPSTVQKYVENEAEKVRLELSEEVQPLMEKDKVAGTTDCWTDDNKKEKYLVVTLHYIKEWLLQSRFLHTITLPHGESCSAENLLILLKRCFTECSIDPALLEKVKWVSDSGSDIKKALEEFCWLYCAAHALNIVLRTALSIKLSDVVKGALNNSETAKQLITEANAWVKEVRAKFSKSKVAVKDFKLRTSVEASQSNVAMLKCIVKHREKVNGILGAEAPTALSSYNNATIQELIDFLWPFDLDGCRGDSPQMTYSRYEGKIKPHLRESPNDSEMIGELKNAARRELTAMQVLRTIDKCKEAVAYLKRSGLFTRLPHAAKQEVSTRWNSYFDMLDSMCDQWEEIRAVLAEANSKLLDGVEYEEVEALCDFLQPFQLHTDVLQSDKRPTILYVEPAVDMLQEHCRPKEGDSPGLAAVRSKAWDLLGEKVIITMEHRIAMFLWPSQKHLQGYTTASKERVCVPAVRERDAPQNRAQDQQTPPVPALVPVSTSIHLTGARTPPDPVASSAEPVPKRRRKEISHNDLYRSQLAVVDEAGLLKDDVQKYIEMKPEEIGNDEDILEWWKIH